MQKALFEFIDNFLALCCPDCCTTYALNNGFIQSVADLVVEAAVEFCLEHCAPEKSAYRFENCPYFTCFFFVQAL